MMISRILASAALACVAAFIASTGAYAQATRTWVSGVGDDANPCSRTAPCKTFAGAISKTAAGGEISVLDPGGYGAVTITKAITINGEGTLASVLVAGTNGIVISAGASDVVTLRNIDITGTGPGANAGINGVLFLAGGALHIEKCQIYGFNGEGVAFTPSTTATLFITDTWIRNNAGGAVQVTPAAFVAAGATLNRVYMLGNQRGLRAEDASSVMVRDSIASANNGDGFAAVGTSRTVELTLENSQSVRNGGGGVFAGPLSTVNISRMSVSRNAVGLWLAGGTILSAGNNMVQRNTMDGAPSSTPGQI
jgi:hypothetical protein